VAESKEQDWEKLKKLLRFLKKTRDDERIVGADNLYHLQVTIHMLSISARAHGRSVFDGHLCVLHAKGFKTEDVLHDMVQKLYGTSTIQLGWECFAPGQRGLHQDGEAW